MITRLTQTARHAFVRAAMIVAVRAVLHASRGWSALRVGVVAIALGCGPSSPSSSPSSATELPLGSTQTITSGRTYVLSGTTIELEMTQLVELDTPSGAVLSAVLDVREGGATERLDLHAYGATMPSPIAWHHFSFLLSTRDYTYGGRTATLTVTREP